MGSAAVMLRLLISSSRPRPRRTPASPATISSSRASFHSPVLRSSDSAEEVEHVARIQRRGVGGDQRRQVGGADDLHAVLHDDLARLPSLRRCRPARPRDRRSPNPASSTATVSALQQLRRRPAGNERRRDHDIHLLAALGDDAGLPRHPFGRHRPRVAAHALGDLPLLVVGVRHVDPLCRRAIRPAPSRTAARRSPRSRRRGAWPSRSPAGRQRPTPMISTRAAFTVPAAVISIGMNFAYSLAASITAL